MLTQNAAALIVGEGLKAVKVEFNEGGKLYSYLCAHEVKVGDKAVVAGFNETLKVVKVIQVLEALDLELDVDYNYKMVIDVVDFSVIEQFEEQKAKLQATIAKVRRKSVLDQVKASLGINTDEPISTWITNKCKDL